MRFLNLFSLVVFVEMAAARVTTVASKSVALRGMLLSTCRHDDYSLDVIRPFLLARK
jgi:hypothetical protein